jgi:hypothetical protein
LRHRGAPGHRRQRALRTRAGKGELDQAFFGQSSSEFTDTFTNLATGASLSIGGRLIGMDVKATPLGGNVFEFKFRESGMVVVRDMVGKVVLREAGAVWTRSCSTRSATACREASSWMSASIGSVGRIHCWKLTRRRSATWCTS